MSIRKLMAKAVENWPAKVLSLGLAIILFVFHRMSILEDRFFSVPLNIEHRGQLMPSSSYPRMVRVSLRGEANSIYPILEEDIDVFVDIEKFEVPGLYTVPVQWRKLGTARAVEPLQITVDPAEITVSLDHRISKLIPLTASFRGQPEAGHAMTSYTLDPAQVIVDGPAELIWDISEIFTEPIDLDGRKSDFVVSVHILNRDNLIIIRGSGTTEFQGNISPIIPVRNIANVPIVITGIAHGLSAELQTRAAGVRLEGYNQDAVSNFRPSPDFLKVDCMGITEPGTYVLRVSHGSAEDMNIRVEPEEVAVVISHAGEGEQY